jgi:phage terminase large subunit-like protein
MRERRKFCRLEWIVRGHDKATMARPLQAMASAGKVKIADTEFGHSLLTQLLQFPAGMHDDDVDMASLMALAIDQAHPAMVKVTEPPKKRDHWDEDEPVSSWKTA